MKFTLSFTLLLALATAPLCIAGGPKSPVVIIGAGLAGSKVAYELSKANVPFIIVEATETVGGRMRSEPLDNKGNVIELGANWIQGCHAENKFCHFVFKNIKPAGVKSDYDDVYFTTNGKLVPDEVADPVWSRWESALTQAYAYLREYATAKDGTILEDISIGSAMLATAGWKANSPMEIAAQRFDIDFEYTIPAEYLSLHELNEYYDPAGEGTFDYFVNDPRHMRELAVWHLTRAGIADPSQSGPNLLLSAPVRNVHHYKRGATVVLQDGTKIEASAVVTTVSVGVLQQSLFRPKENAGIRFEPAFPHDKLVAISKFGMGDFVKFFVEFNRNIFSEDDPLFTIPLECHEGGFHTILNLNKPQYLPGQNIVVLFASAAFARDLECMSKDRQVEEALDFIRKGLAKTVTSLDVKSTIVPKWFHSPYFQGMYSFRPLGFTDKDYEALNRPLGTLFFAGEAHSYKDHGYMQGAWDSGATTAADVVKFLK